MPQEAILNDRERILSIVVRQLMSTQLHRHGDGYRSETYRGIGGWEHVHFAFDQTPVKGDLVIAQSTLWPNRWSIGWFESHEAGGKYVIREIGTGILCNYSNETFIPIRGMNPIDLLEGKEREFYLKVLKAFQKGSEYSYRFGGIKFDGTDVTITIREKFGGSLPFDVVVPYQKMSITKILALLREGGYGSRKFVKPDKPEQE